MAQLGRRIVEFRSSIRLTPNSSQSRALRLREVSTDSITLSSNHASSPRLSRMYSSTQTSMSAKMSRSIETMVLRIQDPGPNPQKVGIVLEELQLPFIVEIIHTTGQEGVKSKDVRNGGAPPVEDKNTGMIVLQDPNSNISLWESLAIVEYLVQTYDQEGTLRYAANTQHWWMCQQWLAYQMGAQSPFFSLKAWFSNKHREKVDSVTGRFADDVVRIASILEHYLDKNGSGFLVGDKCTYADLAFVPWNNKIGAIISGPVDYADIGTEEVMGTSEAATLLQRYPHYRDWHQRLIGRPAVQRILTNDSISSQ